MESRGVWPSLGLTVQLSETSNAAKCLDMHARNKGIYEASMRMHVRVCDECVCLHMMPAITFVGVNLPNPRKRTTPGDSREATAVCAEAAARE